MGGLGALIRRKREELQLSQAALATAAGIDRAYLNQIENGRVDKSSPEIRRALARELGVSHLELLVAAGQLTPEEAGLVASSDTTDPELAQLCAALASIPLSAAFKRHLWAIIRSEREEMQSAPQPVGASRS